MDKEIMELLINLKIDEKTLQLLIDIILDNARLAYDNESLVINNDSAVFAVIKAFRPDEYNNRFAALKAELVCKADPEEA